MKRFIVAAFSLFVVGCGVSPEQACKDDAPVTCEKMWTCNAAFKIGTDQASCTTQTQALCTLSAGGCQNGKTYHADKALTCTDAKKAQTCEQYNAAPPPSCAEICT